MSVEIPTAICPVLSFDGAGDYIDLQLDAALCEHAVTVEMWVFGRSALPHHTVLLNASDAGKERVLNIHLPWSGKLYWDAGSGVSGWDRIHKALPAQQYKDSWNHWAFVKDTDRQQMRIHRNGELWHQGSGEWPMTAIQRLRVGTGTNATRNFWSGSLSELRLWRVARSPDQIRAGMHRRCRGKEGDLVLYWPLDEGAGTTVTDRSGAGHDGAIIGATWSEAELPLTPPPPLICEGTDYGYWLRWRTARRAAGDRPGDYRRGRIWA